MLKIFYIYINGKVKQSFTHDVIVSMKILLDQINELNQKEKVEDNLFVKNLIINKDKNNKEIIPYIATEKWISQLGERLQIN